jgi:flagellar hook-associated protein 3 FlgL
MRISTAQIYSNGTNGILKLQSDIYKIQNQEATGKKVVNPSDDPVAAAQILLVSQAKSVNELYIDNQGTASSTLSSLDSTLQSIYDELSDVYSSAVQAGNASYSDAQRADIATELSQNLTNLLSLANTQDGNGRYIFAGTKSTTEPFTVNTGADSTTDYSSSGNSYVTYNGNDGEQALQVGTSQYVTTNETGSNVFMRVKDESGTATGGSVFDAVQNLVEYLNTAGGTASDAEYTQALSDIQAAMDTVSIRQAAVGASESALTTMTSISEDKKTQYEARLSDLQDLDLVAATTEITLKQTQLSAAASSFASSSQLSLFDYI